jgi:molybdate transport system permease protein
MVPAVLATLLLLVPLVAMVASTRWQALPGHLTTRTALDALRLSLLTSTAAIAFCLLLGLPLAWLLARVDFRGRGALRALVTVPLVLPPVVAGVALRSAFGRSGVIGEPLLDWTGFAFPFTTWGVVLAHVFVSMPFVVIAIEGALRSADPRYDAAAATLGATRWTTFRRVTVPLALPGVIAGTVLGWARSLGEFGATITFNGNYPGTTQTMPTLIYVTRQADQDAALSLSLVMLLVSIGVLVALRDHWLGTP